MLLSQTEAGPPSGNSTTPKMVHLSVNQNQDSTDDGLLTACLAHQGTGVPFLELDCGLVYICDSGGAVEPACDFVIAESTALPSNSIRIPTCEERHRWSPEIADSDQRDLAESVQRECAA